MQNRKLQFAAFSDPHLGRTWSAHTVPNTREALTERYHDPILEAVFRYADKGVPLLCGGDWFDKAHNNERLIRASDRALKRMALVVAGNHDHAGRESAVTSLQLLHGMQETSPVSIATDHLNDPAVNLHYLGDVAVYSVPHHATQALFEQAIFEAEAHAKGEAGHKVIVLHCNFGAPGGGKPDTNLYLTAPLQKALEGVFDFILLGHEHLPRRIGSKVIIMGSTQPCNFGELGPRFFYEFFVEDGKLQVALTPIQTGITYRVWDVTEKSLSEALPDPVELVDLRGTLPVKLTPQVQKLVRQLYAGGALAVRMGITFETGKTLDGDAVSGSMRNLIDVVRYEISENQAWTQLLDDALAAINEEKA